MPNCKSSPGYDLVCECPRGYYCEDGFHVRAGMWHLVRKPKRLRLRVGTCMLGFAVLAAIVYAVLLGGYVYAIGRVALCAKTGGWCP